MKEKTSPNGLSGGVRSEGAGEQSEPASERMAPPESGRPSPLGPLAGGLAEQANAEKSTRRRFSAQEKLRVLRLADACERGSSDLGALLRREGIYHSALARWRKQRDEGLLAGNGVLRGRKPTTLSLADLRALEKENRRLKAQLEEARLCLDLQKKASEILGIRLSPLPDSLKDL